ncbi:MAG: response regulator receiver [Bacteroidetes bacterium]|nr:response regulator receiver [Bacteroidota bacterium]
MILYADDDPDDHEFFREALSRLDFKTELFIVWDGTEVIPKLAAVKPDLIFLDINMPKKCGRQCLKEIRSDNTFADTPVIIHSTAQDEKDINFTRKHGANLYVVKSCTMEAQMAVLKLILSLYNYRCLSSTNKNDFVLLDHKRYSRNLKLDLK